jgi:formylmethanofuran dehydrogenase subunit E
MMSARCVAEETIQKARDFHGHMCPGLAIGIRAAEMALREMGGRSEDEETVAVVETDMCGVDAIQALTGCTFGKGNFIHKDYGKLAFSFYRRSDGKGIRIVAQPSAMALSDAGLRQEREALVGKRHGGDMTPREKDRFAELQGALIEQLLSAPLESLFDLKAPPAEIPRPARIHGSIACEGCGENVMQTRIREIGGKMLCVPCSEKAS